MHPATRHLPPTAWPTASTARSSRLFAPGRLGPVTTRTRTWVPAMVPWRASATGDVTPAVTAWYTRFAQGLPGVLVLEATGIRDVPSGPLLRISHDRNLPGLTNLSAAIRTASEGRTRTLLQLIDFLAIKRRPAPADFFRRFLRITDEHRARLAALDPALASADDATVREALLALDVSRLQDVLAPREYEDLTRGYRERVTDTHLPHIAALPRELPMLFAAAAKRAELAGFDGVELHYAHAYTMASFLSRTNTRADGYGGSLENRARLAVEVLQAVRAAVSPRFAVGCRLLGDEVIEHGSRVEDAIHHSLALARAGIDFVSVSKGGKFDDAKAPKVGEAIYPYTGPSGKECMPTRNIDERGPFGRNLHLARAIRDALRADGRATPVVGAGGINSFELAEDALASGACDFVASARQSLADPDWWRKMELGRGAEVRRCVFTNYCEALDQRHAEVTCQLWDRDLDARDSTSPDGRPALSGDGKRRLVPPAWD